MKLTKTRISLIILGLIVLAIAGVAFYYYQQGGVEHYVPPAEKSVSLEAQAMKDLTTLSKAIEAYNSMNLKFPDRLEDLQPDFVSKVPVDPATRKPYFYQTDGTSKYRIAVRDPSAYGKKVITIEN